MNIKSLLIIFILGLFTLNAKASYLSTVEGIEQIEAKVTVKEGLLKLEKIKNLFYDFDKRSHRKVKVVIDQTSEDINRVGERICSLYNSSLHSLGVKSKRNGNAVLENLSCSY